MRFEKGLRGISLKPYPVGYTAMPTGYFNKEVPALQIGAGTGTGTWVEEENYPLTIELEVRMSPLWVDNGTAIARFQKSTPCPIYPQGSVYAGIAIHSLGRGVFSHNLNEMGHFVDGHILNHQLVTPTPCLYQKDFLTQGIGRQISYDPGAEETPFHWAYGGVEVDGDIHPFIFTLESIRDETVVRASSLLGWRERGILPRMVGKEMGNQSPIVDLFEVKQTFSLKESIEAAESQIFLMIGVDEKGQQLKISYYSQQLKGNTICYRKGGTI